VFAELRRPDGSEKTKDSDRPDIEPFGRGVLGNLLKTHVQERKAGGPELTYPFHDRDVVITACGRLCLHRKRINISTVLAGQKLGIKEVDEGIWLVSFMHYDLGYFDLEQKTLQPFDNPFGTKLSPIVLGTSVTDVSGLDKAKGGGVRSRMRTRLSGDSALETAAIRCFPLSLVKTGNTNPKDFGFRACYP
jgi:hypothetical protein